MTKAFRVAFVAALIINSAACRKDRTVENKPDSSAQPAVTAPVNSAAPPTFTSEQPKLSCLIQNVSLYPVPNKPEDLAISVVVSVENSGAPATAQEWKLTVQSPNHADYGSLDPVHVNGVVDMPGRKATRVDLSKEDLAVKARDTQVTKFAPVRGVLTFVLPKTSLEDLSNNQSSFTIHFKDNQNGSYRSAKTVIGPKR